MHAQKKRKREGKQGNQSVAEPTGDEEATSSSGRQEPAGIKPRLSSSGKPIGWSFLPGDDSERWQPDGDERTSQARSVRPRIDHAQKGSHVVYKKAPLLYSAAPSYNSLRLTTHSQTVTHRLFLTTTSATSRNRTKTGRQWW